MNKIPYILIGLLLTAISLFNGCSDDTVSAGKEKVFTINVNVLDENKEPLKGVEIITSPATVTHVTNQYGNVSMKNIPAGSYQVIVIHKDIPVYFQNINLDYDSEVDLQFVVATKVDLNLIAVNAFGELLANVDIVTIPSTQKVTTDENGSATLEDIPLQEYTFIVSRDGHNIIVQARKIQLANGTAKDITFLIVSQPPIMNITYPNGGYLDDIYDVTFIGEGFDFEDGYLPEKDISWHSNIQGLLGTGSEITVERMSVGHHVITLQGIDSDGHVSTDSFGIDLYYYDKDSYFPIPKGAEWFYNYDITEFEMVNADGETEYWTLNDLQATMEDIDARTSFMEYSIKNGDTTRLAQYVVVDHFATNADSMYVYKTEERLSIYYSKSLISNPYREMDIHIDYHNLEETGESNYGYPLIKDHLDPASISSFATTVSADVTWNYEDEVYGSQEFFETLEIETSVDIGIPETVQTDAGSFDDAVPMTITQGESIRNWWLVKGIGLVKIQFNTFGFMETATLYGTNIESFRTQGVFGTGKTASSKTGNTTIQKELSSLPGSAEEMREIRNFLRGLLPR